MMTPKTTNRDSILDEIHGTRERIAEKFGGDIAAILDDARKRQEASGAVVWHGVSTRKRLHPTAACAPK